MKKTTLLSLVTAATVVATSAGTFAIWDNKEAKTTDAFSLKAGTPINMKISASDFAAGTTVSKGSDATTTVSVTPTNLEGSGNVKLTVLNPNSIPNGVKVTFKDDQNVDMPDTGFAVTDGTAQTYTVVVSINEDELGTQDLVDALSGQAISFDVKAVLETK